MRSKHLTSDFQRFLQQRLIEDKLEKEPPIKKRKGRPEDELEDEPINGRHIEPVELNDETELEDEPIDEIIKHYNKLKKQYENLLYRRKQ